jgi:hypothetical protein
MVAGRSGPAVAAGHGVYLAVDGEEQQSSGAANGLDDRDSGGAGVGGTPGVGGLLLAVGEVDRGHAEDLGVVQFGSQPVELFVVEGLEHRLGGRGEGGEPVDGADCGVGGHGKFSERLWGRGARRLTKPHLYTQKDDSKLCTLSTQY